MQVKNFARVADSIIGWGSSIGRWARIDNKSVIGEDVHIKARPTGMQYTLLLLSQPPGCVRQTQAVCMDAVGSNW